MNPFFANPPGVMFLFPFSLSLYSSRYCAVLPKRWSKRQTKEGEEDE